jgi:hypothetical protein
MAGGVSVEGQHLQPRREPFHLAAVVLGPGGPGGAVQQFGQDDGGYRQAVGLGVEPRAQRLGRSLSTRMQRFVSSI